MQGARAGISYSLCHCWPYASWFCLKGLVQIKLHGEEVAWDEDKQLFKVSSSFLASCWLAASSRCLHQLSKQLIESPVSFPGQASLFVGPSLSGSIVWDSIYNNIIWAPSWLEEEITTSSSPWSVSSLLAPSCIFLVWRQMWESDNKTKKAWYGRWPNAAININICPP